MTWLGSVRLPMLLSRMSEYLQRLFHEIEGGKQVSSLSYTSMRIPGGDAMPQKDISCSAVEHGSAMLCHPSRAILPAKILMYRGLLRTAGE
jgi:hypothetical protein